ncbi:MAG: hypothetical protein P8Z81_02020 [Deinococcales bacterium]
MERESTRSWVAGLLIAVGVLVILERAGWLVGIGSWLWGLAFLAGGGLFIGIYVRDRRRWWALFPGFALAGLAAAVLLSSNGGALFLAVLGLAFALVYAGNRQRWWAIIPAGTLATLALVAWTQTRWPGTNSGWLFFGGLAATFAALLAQPPERRQRWAVYPALGLAAVALLTLLSSRTGPIVVAAVAIVVGVALLFRAGLPSSDRGPGRGRPS